MKIEIYGKLVEGEILPINTKGCEEIEIDVFNDVNCLSMNRELRLIGLNKNGLYKMTMKSLSFYFYKSYISCAISIFTM